MSAKSRRRALSAIDCLSSSTPKVSANNGRTRKSVSALKLETNLLSESVDNNLSTSLSSSKTSDQDDFDKSKENIFAVDDLVWAKAKGFQYWPAKIIKKPLVKNDSSNKCKEYYVTFFGQHQTSYVSQSSIKPYSSEKIRIDALKRIKKEKHLKESIDEADREAQRSVVLNSTGIKINGVNSAVSNNELPSVEEELNLIKKSKSYTKGESSFMNDSDTKSNGTPNLSRRSVRSCCSKTNELATVLQNKSNIKTPSQLQQQRSKIARLTGEELEKAIKSSKQKFEEFRLKSAEINTIKEKMSNKKKRSLSVDIKTELIMSKTNNENTPLMESKTKKRRTKYKDEDDAHDESQREQQTISKESSSSQLEDMTEACAAESPLLPIDLGLSQTSEAVSNATNLLSETNALKFKSVTLIVDTNSTIFSKLHALTYYLIEKLGQYYEQIGKQCGDDQLLVSVYDISVCTKKKQQQQNNTTTNSTIEEQNGKPISPNSSSYSLEDEPEEFELVSQAKSPISNSSIKIEKKKRDKRKVLESYLNTNVVKLSQIQLNFVNEFNQAIKSDLILSLVDCSSTDDSDKNVQIFNQCFEDYDVQNLKYISLAPLKCAHHYHYHFKYTGASFLEAPLHLVSTLEKETNLRPYLKLYVSSWGNEFYSSCLKLLNLLVEEKNIIFKDTLFGAPSKLVRALKTTQLEETLDAALEQLMQTEWRASSDLFESVLGNELQELIDFKFSLIKSYLTRISKN